MARAWCGVRCQTVRYGGLNGVNNAALVLIWRRPNACILPPNAGELVATDLRMMSSRQFIWTIPRTHGSSPVTVLAQWGHTADGALQLPPAQGPAPAGHPHPHLHQQQQASEAKMCNLLVSGGKDGSLALVDISAGKVGQTRSSCPVLGARLRGKPDALGRGPAGSRWCWPLLSA